MIIIGSLFYLLLCPLCYQQQGHFQGAAPYLDQVTFLGPLLPPGCLSSSRSSHFSSYEYESFYIWLKLCYLITIYTTQYISFCSWFDSNGFGFGRQYVCLGVGKDGFGLPLHLFGLVLYWVAGPMHWTALQLASAGLKFCQGELWSSIVGVYYDQLLLGCNKI